MFWHPVSGEDIGHRAVDTVPALTLASSQFRAKERKAMRKIAAE
jgi:hypothetical protein